MMIARRSSCAVALLSILILMPCRAQAKHVATSHPRVIRDPPTMKPSRTHQAEDFHPDWYHLGTRHKIVVGIDYDAAKQPVRVDWRERNRFHSQRLDMPLLSTGQVAPQVPDDPDDRKFWWPYEAEAAEATEYTPIVFLWKGLANPTLVVMGYYVTGAYGVRAPLIFTLKHRTWQLIPIDPNYLMFTNRGAFFVRRHRPYVWDYAMDSIHAHGAPQQYYLHIFELRRGTLRLVYRRMTRKLYSMYDDFTSFPDKVVPTAYDPLREFGLRWRWWGQSAQ